MALKLVSPSNYIIDIPSFENCVFTDSSSELFPQEIEFCRQRGAHLQSAREAVAFRIAAYIDTRRRTAEEEKADAHQSTRTYVIYFKYNNRFFVAFDDDINDNILLNRSQEGLESHLKNRYWHVQISDPCIERALQRARKSDRIVDIAKEYVSKITLEPDRLSLFGDSGDSEYGKSHILHAIIGSDLARQYAKYLHNRGYEVGNIHLLPEERLNGLGVDAKIVEIRRVSVQAIGYVDRFSNLPDGLVAVAGCNTPPSYVRGVYYRPKSTLKVSIPQVLRNTTINVPRGIDEVEITTESGKVKVPPNSEIKFMRKPK